VGINRRQGRSDSFYTGGIVQQPATSIGESGVKRIGRPPINGEDSSVGRDSALILLRSAISGCMSHRA
jgi:hypothetical protein